MRKRFKQVLLLALACALLTGLVACGGGDDESSSASSSTTPEEISGTITVWDVAYRSFPDYTKAAEELDAEFKTLHPGVTIKHVPQVFGTYPQVLQAAFTGRTGPDVMMLHPGTAPTGVLLRTEGLETLNDRVTGDMRDRLAGWDAISPGFTGEGDVYAIPVGVQGEIFYYNKKLFRQAGLPTEFEPRTWDEVVEAGRKLKAAGITPFTGGNKEGYEHNWWLQAGWQTANTAEDAVALSNGEIPFTDPKVAAAYAPEKMIQDAGLFREDRFTTPLFPDGALAFGDGRAGMFLGLWSVAAYYGDYIPRLGEENVGIFFPPGSNYIGAEPGFNWTIPKFAKNKDAAWAYIDFVTSTRSLQKLYEEGGLLPNDKNVTVAADAPAQEREIIDVMRTSDTHPRVAEMIPGAVLTAHNTELNEVLQGRKSMDDALQVLQDTAERNAE